MAILTSPLDQKKPTAAKDSRRRSSLISDSLAHPRASYYLVLVPTVLLLAIGMLMVWSASSVFGYVRFDDAYYFVKRQVFFLVIGGLAAFVLSKCSTGTLRVLGWVLVVVSLGLQILTFTPLGWGEAKGNRNWVQFGTSFFRIQPSELAKLAIIVWGADLLSRKQKLLDQPKHLLFPFIPVSAVLIGLVVLNRDLGTGMVMGAIVMAMLWHVGASWRMLASIAGTVVAVVVLLIATSINRMDRILGFFNSGHDVMGVNLQPLRGVFALATGGWWGVGLGASRQKWGSLAEAHTDYVLAIVGEELGLVGTLLVLALFGAVAYAAIRLAINTADPFVRYVAAGVTIWLMSQMIINIGMVLALLPVIGIPLPLVSYGGSALVPSMVALGLLVGFARAEPEAAAALRDRRGAARKSGKVTLPGAISAGAARARARSRRG